jgi:hypothetical protein
MVSRGDYSVAGALTKTGCSWPSPRTRGARSTPPSASGVLVLEHPNGRDERFSYLPSLPSSDQARPCRLPAGGQCRVSHPSGRENRSADVAERGMIDKRQGVASRRYSRVRFALRNRPQRYPAISGNGWIVAFQSQAADLLCHLGVARPIRTSISFRTCLCSTAAQP